MFSIQRIVKEKWITYDQNADRVMIVEKYQKLLTKKFAKTGLRIIDEESNNVIRLCHS